MSQSINDHIQEKPVKSDNPNPQISHPKIPVRFRPIKPPIASVSPQIRQFEELKALGVEAYYIENFFSKAESDLLFTQLKQDYPFRQEQSRAYGIHDQPRLTRFMGEEGKSYYYSGQKREAVGWIAPAKHIRDQLMKFVHTLRPDHPEIDTVLGNLYRDGKDYIAEHADDETDLTSDAFICSITFCDEPRDFDIFEKLPNGKTGKRLLRVPLAHGSLFIMGRAFQKKCKHGVPKRLRIKTPRINLTFRCLDPVRDETSGASDSGK